MILKKLNLSLSGPCGVVPAEDCKGASSMSNAHVMGVTEQCYERMAEKCLEGKGFCKSVIENLLRPKKRNSYTNADISEAVILRSISKHAYNTLRHNKMTLKPLLARQSRHVFHSVQWQKHLPPQNLLPNSLSSKIHFEKTPTVRS